MTPKQAAKHLSDRGFPDLFISKAEGGSGTCLGTKA